MHPTGDRARYAVLPRLSPPPQPAGWEGTGRPGSRAEQGRAEQAAGRGGGGCVGEGPSCDTRPCRFPFKLHLSVLVTHHDDAGCEAEVGIILPAAASGAVESSGTNVGLAAGGQWRQRGGGAGRPNAVLDQVPAAPNARQSSRPYLANSRFHWMSRHLHTTGLSVPMLFMAARGDLSSSGVGTTAKCPDRPASCCSSAQGRPLCLLACCVRCPGVSFFAISGTGGFAAHYPLT